MGKQALDALREKKKGLIKEYRGNEKDSFGRKKYGIQ
jgi:hypothetical protein